MTMAAGHDGKSGTPHSTDEVCGVHRHYSNHEHDLPLTLGVDNT